MTMSSRGAILSLGLVLTVWAVDPGRSLAAPKLASPATTYKEKLVGKWEILPEGEKDDLVTPEFKADCSVKLSFGPFEMADVQGHQ